MTIDTQMDDSKVLDFDPAFDPSAVAEIEKTAQGCGVDRRIAFIVATKSRSELVEALRGLVATDEEALFEMLDGIRGLIEHYECSTKLFSAVEARLFVAAHAAFDISLD